jgi:hypothetical protein
VSDTAARRLSTLAPGTDDAATAVAMEDAMEDAVLEAGEDEEQKEES